MLDINEPCDPKSTDQVKLMLEKKEKHDTDIFDSQKTYDEKVDQEKLNHDKKMSVMRKNHDANILNKKRLYEQEKPLFIDGESSTSEPLEKRQKTQ